MKKSTSRGGRVFSEESSARGQRFDRLKNYEDDDADVANHHGKHRQSDASPASSPFLANHDSADPAMNADESALSPFAKSPWTAHTHHDVNMPSSDDYLTSNALLGSLVREEGHIYSLTASGDLLYTGSDSKNIRVWRNQMEYSAFKSNSGLVKAIVIAGDKIFTGHQDGRIRVWKISSKNAKSHKQIGTLPTLKNYIKCSMKPSNYVEVRRHRSVLWIKHFDAISCLGLSEDGSFLYSASWDKTFKVWRVSNFKCLESVAAHDDAVNSLVTGFDGLVFTGSADGTVKVWRRELQGKKTKHFFSQTLLKQECAVTALAVNPEATFVYSGSSDGIVNYWEREKSLSHGGVLKGHKLAVLCLATAGSLVISGSADMAICVWRRSGSDHICLSMLINHTGPVKCLAVQRDRQSSPEDKRWILYSGSLDKSVKMWRVSEQAAPLRQDHQQQVAADGKLNSVPRNSSLRRMGSSRRY